VRPSREEKLEAPSFSVERTSQWWKKHPFSKGLHKGKSGKHEKLKNGGTVTVKNCYEVHQC